MRFLVCLFGVALGAAQADAAIWEWGCQGQIGEQQVVFNRTAMVVADTKAKMGDIRKLRLRTLELPAGSPPHADYEPIDINGGLDKTMSFLRKGDDKHKITLAEKSSKQTGHSHRIVCGRDEDQDIYRKVYELKRDDEPPRDITMQCFEYQLSTRGGRKGCSDD